MKLLSISQRAELFGAFIRVAWLLTTYSRITSAFVVGREGSRHSNIRAQSDRYFTSISASIETATDGWVSLTGPGDFAVKKRIIEEGTGDDDNIAQKGEEVSIEYAGTIASDDWSANDVVECWLKEQQGLDSLAPSFIEQDIDLVKVKGGEDGASFLLSEEFISSELGVTNRIQCKKIIMAAKRLMKEKEEFPVGKEFDASRDRGDGSYTFVLGKNKVIQAMDLTVATMKPGEKAEFITRPDYAYGKDGLRSSKGDVIVPPFATLRFEIKLL